MKRDIVLDIVRALCAIEIVAFWHLSNYLPEEYAYGPITKYVGGYLTSGTLACFTFLSGYFLRKYKMNKCQDLISFYKKRLNRFYILYFISAFTLFLGGLIVKQNFFADTTQFILTLCGLGCFHKPYPPTLWYFCMIMFFYLITPLLLIYENRAKRCILSIAILALLFFFKISGLLDIDERLLAFFPFYALGMIVPKKIIEAFKTWKICFFTLPLWVLIIWWLKTNYVYAGIVPAIIFIITIVSISSLLEKQPVLTKGLLLISYGSMVAYLFHRHFYLAAVVVFNFGKNVNYREASIPILVAIIVVIPIIFTSSYYIQLLYDKLVKKINK